MYDFEDSKKTTSQKDRYRDVEMFLEDSLIFHKGKKQQQMLKEMLTILKRNHTVVRKEIKKIGISTREVVFREFNYNPVDFGYILMKILEKRIY